MNDADLPKWKLRMTTPPDLGAFDCHGCHGGTRGQLVKLLTEHLQRRITSKKN